MTRGNAIAIALGGIVIALYMIVTFAAFQHAKPSDPRDPRCDTAARYDAMRDGADCNVPMTKAERHYGCRFADADKHGGECP